MTNSQNGWPVLEGYGDKRLVGFNWITGKVRGGDVAYILNHYATWYNSNIEKIDVKSSWGFAPRPIRGGSTPSNHASGTAIDLNANKHPLGKRNTFSKAQQTKIATQLKVYGGALRSGIWYPQRADDMHIEINCSAAKLAEVVAKLKGVGEVKPTAPSKPVPKPTGKSWPDVDLKVTDNHTAESDAAWRKLLSDVGYKDKNLTTNMQRWLKDLGYYKGLVEADHGKKPVFGPMLVGALQTFLKKKKLYLGLLDDKREAMTIRAEIAYLNEQRKAYK